MLIYLAISHRDRLDTFITRLLASSVWLAVSFFAICAEGSAGFPWAAHALVRYAGSDANFAGLTAASVELRSGDEEMREIWIWAASH